MGEVWLVHNADTLCTEQGERRPEGRELLCLNFPCLAIKYEFISYFNNGLVGNFILNNIGVPLSSSFEVTSR